MVYSRRENHDERWIEGILLLPLRLSQIQASSTKADTEEQDGEDGEDGRRFRRKG